MSDWTDERIAQLKRLWLAGFTCSQIAERLRGVTRNAVIGKVTRLKLPPRGHRKANRSQAQIRTVRSRRRARKNTSAASSLPAWWPATPIPAEDVQPEKLITFAELETKHCRWIYGDPQHADHGYCGGEMVLGLPYCAKHAQRAYAAPEVRSRKLICVAPASLNSKIVKEFEKA